MSKHWVDTSIPMAFGYNTRGPLTRLVLPCSQARSSHTLLVLPEYTRYTGTLDLLEKCLAGCATRNFGPSL